MEIEAEKAGLRALKPGSDDYMMQTKAIMTKQATLQAQQEFYKQQLEFKDRQWTEKFYSKILKKVGEAAKDKNLNLVLEKGEVEFPSASINDLMVTIRTHKVLYDDGCIDITDDVIARLDDKK